MMTSSDIKIPLQLEDLREDGNCGFHVSEILDEDTSTCDDFSGIIDDFIMTVESEVDLEQRHIDAMFNMVTCFPNLSPEQKSDCIGSLINLSNQKLDILADQHSTKNKNDFKVSNYFLQMLAIKAEALNSKSAGVGGEPCATEKKSSKGKGTKSKRVDPEQFFQWSEWRSPILQHFQRALATDPSIMWFMAIPEDAFLCGMWKYCMQLLEDKPAGVGGTGGAETSLRGLCVNIIFTCAKQLASSSTSGDGLTTLCTASIDSICRLEHMGSYLADICMKENGRFAAELMSEVGSMNLTELNKNATGVKNVGTFLVTLSECAPDLMASYFPSFIHLLDSEIYQIRSSIIHVMGSVIIHTHKICAPTTDVGSPIASGENDESIEKKNEEQLKRVRDSILDMLVERTYDVSSFTRAAVLKTWSAIAEAGAVPLSRFEAVAEVAVDRLKDKTAAVRKASVSLLICLLDNNPFGGTLAAAQYVVQKTGLEEQLKYRLEKLNDQFKQSNQGAVSIAGSSAVKKETVDEDAIEGVEDIDSDEEPVEVTEDTDVVILRNGIKFCDAAIRFIAATELSVPKITQMLASKTTTDVVEALKFIARSVKFSIESCLKLFHGSFALIWHQDEAVKKESLNAFLSVYLTDGAIGVEPELLPADLIAKNLVNVCIGCDTSALASMEKIIGLLFADNYLSEDSISSLWKMINSLSSLVIVHLEDGSVVPPEIKQAEKELAGALRVIAMASKFSPSILSPVRLNSVLNILLSSAVKQRMLFPIMLASAQCLQSISADISPSSGSLSGDKDGSTAATRSLLLDSTEGISMLLIGQYIKEDSELSKQWFAAAEELIHGLFHTHPCPDIVLARVIAVLYDRVFTADASSSGYHCSSGSLSRLLFVLGQGAICSLVYAEKLAGVAKKSRERKATMDKESKLAHAMEGSDDCEGDAKEDAGDSMEAEMGMAAAADAEHDQFFQRVIEVDLVYNESNILGKFHQMIAFVVANEKGNFSDSIVRSNALLALCRYMTVSSVMCELYLPLLFTTLERERSEENKTTIIIALGDLAFRFPNSLEPWIAYIYARLSDQSLLVRYNTLMVLTHLILNDMVKVKGQVSHIVMCLNDESKRIQSLASLFFSELSKRSNNPVYNLLGDVISFLSRDEDNIAAVSVNSSSASLVAHRKLTENEFQTTMTFLLSFVKKDKQADSLLERLVLRMGITVGLMQRRYLAFCISLLPITEKGVKKMTELIRHIKDSLVDDTISEYFKTCISRVKKTFVKGVAEEVNTVLDEFEKAVSQIRGDDELMGKGNDDKMELVGTEDSKDEATAATRPVADENKPIHTDKKSKASSKGKSKVMKKPKSRRVVSSDESDGGDDSEVETKEIEDSDGELSFSSERNAAGPEKRVLGSTKGRKPLREVGNKLR